MLLNLLERKSSWLGKIVVRMLGTAWSILIYFIAPVLVNEELNVKDSVKRSSQIFAETWGENFIGAGGMGLMFFLIFLVLTIPLGLGFYLSATLNSFQPLIICAIIWIVLMIGFAIFQSTINSVYRAALYFYAAEKKSPIEFDQNILKSSFIPSQKV